MRAQMTTSDPNDLMSYRAWVALREAERKRWVRVGILALGLIVVIAWGIFIR